MLNHLMRKNLILGIIVLLISSSVVSSYQIHSSPQSLSRGWLYVGGDGPGNYTSIQSAIDVANPGDTVFVYNGTYYEILNLNKTINLNGENKNTTIIDGIKKQHVIIINHDNVNISGFSIHNVSDSSYADPGYSILIQSNGNNISENIIESFYNPNDDELPICSGITLRESDNNIISNNVIKNQSCVSIYLEFYCDNNLIYQNIIGAFDIIDRGVGIYHSKNNCIYDNIISNSDIGIEMINSTNNVIDNNSISGGSWLDDNFGITGIYLYDSFPVTISGNTISKDDEGIRMTYVHDSNISFNNIYNCSYGIALNSCYNLSIYMNDISNCSFGILLVNCGNNTNLSLNINQPVVIKKNNLYKNSRNLKNTFDRSYFHTVWENNFWGKARSFPKIILVIWMITPKFGIPAKVQFDWHPAKQPYDIPRIAN